MVEYATAFENPKFFPWAFLCLSIPFLPLGFPVFYKFVTGNNVESFHDVTDGGVSFYCVVLLADLLYDTLWVETLSKNNVVSVDVCLMIVLSLLYVTEVIAKEHLIRNLFNQLISGWWFIAICFVFYIRLHWQVF